LGQQFSELAIAITLDLGAETKMLGADALADNPFQAGEGPAADKEDIGRVDLQKLLLWMLAACCTPSPETSRVIDGESDLRAILSTSSM